MENLFLYVFFGFFCVFVVWCVVMMALAVKGFVDKLRWDREKRELEWKGSHGR